MQLARMEGCRVLAAVRNDDGDINTTWDPGLAKIDTLTAGKGLDLVIDTVGEPEVTRAAIAKLSRGGRLALLTARGTNELGLDMVDIYRNEKILLGCNSLLYPVEELAALMKVFTGAFEKGRLKAASNTNWTVVKLENAVETYEKANQHGAGRYMIAMN